MLHAARNDDEFSRHDQELILLAVVAYFHSQGALYHVEQLVFVLVVVPVEFTLDLRHLHVKIVDLADDLRSVVLLEQRELRSDIDLSEHASSVARGSRRRESLVPSSGEMSAGRSWPPSAL